MKYSLLPIQKYGFLLAVIPVVTHCHLGAFIFSAVEAGK